MKSSPPSRLRRLKYWHLLLLCFKLVSVRRYILLYRLRRYRHQDSSQHDRLQALVSFCLTKVPYYKSACRGIMSPGAVEFSDLPIVNKAAIRANFADLIAVGRAGIVLGDDPFWVVKTGGSTGIPCSYLKSRTDMLANISSLADIFSEYSIRRYGNLFDLGLHWSRQPLVQARMFPGAFVCWNFSGYTFDKEELRQECLAIAGAARPRVIYGAPSRIIALAKLCGSEGVTLRPSIVITSYEHLSKAGEGFLRAAFNCPVIQVYGTAETGIAAWTCTHGRWHFDPQVVALELVRADGSYTAPGELGRIILTPLDLRTMPLLRFDTGDLAIHPWSNCQCGRNSPSIEHLEGRDAALIETSSGNLFSPFAIYGYVDSLGIPEAQIIQRAPGDLELVFPTGTIVPEAALEDLAAKIRGYLEGDVNIKISADSSFVRTLHGKRNAFVQMNTRDN